LDFREYCVVAEKRTKEKENRTGERGRGYVERQRGRKMSGRGGMRGYWKIG
jgi:hypothetical protein